MNLGCGRLAVWCLLGGLVAGSCGGDAAEQAPHFGEGAQVSTTANTSPVPTSSSSTTKAAPTATTALAAPLQLLPDQPIHDSCLEPPNTESFKDPANVLRIEPEEVSPGQEVTFTWGADDGGEYITGDEMVISCWNGFEWTAVWYAFSTFDESSSTAVLTPGTIERLVFTSDAFADLVGVFSVPLEAPSGTYRVTGTISFGPPGEGSTALDGYATFVVSA